MELPTAVVTHLRALFTSMEADSEALVKSLAELAADVHAVIASYRGLLLTVVLHDWPIALVAFTSDDNRPIVTSLRLPLEVVDPAHEAGGSIVFYAAAPGALVDLAADLSYALGVKAQGPTIDLDTDLPPPSLRSGLTGLAEYSEINRALGKLIERGQEPALARQTLRRGAAAAGLAPHAYARRLLADD